MSGDGLTTEVPLPLHLWLRWSPADRRASGRINPETGTFETRLEFWRRLDFEAAERRRKQELEDQREQQAEQQARAERRVRGEQLSIELAPKYAALMVRLAAALDEALAVAEEANGLVRDLVDVRGGAVVDPLVVIQGDMVVDLKSIRKRLPDQAGPGGRPAWMA